MEQSKISSHKSLILKIVISLVLVAITTTTVLLFVFLNRGNNDYKNVEIKIVDINNNVVSDDTFQTNHEFLAELIIEKYEVRTSDSTYGKILYDISTIKTDFTTTYIAIYVDDKYATSGISSIVLYDNMRVTFIETRVRR